MKVSLPEWVSNCDDLAPYLKEKLAKDKNHTWQTAPYIHDEIREILEEITPACGMTFTASPMVPSLPYGYYPYSQMTLDNAANTNSYTALENPEARIMQLKALIAAQMQQQALAIALNAMTTNAYTYFPIYQTPYSPYSLMLQDWGPTH